MLMTLASAILLLSVADQEGVIVTAPEGRGQLPPASAAPIEAASPRSTVSSVSQPHGLSTADQIASWIGQDRAVRAGSDRPWDDAIAEAGPRKPHGEFSVGMGTGGYRDYSAAVQLPLGESGTLSLAVRQSKNDPYAFDPYYPSYRGLGYGGFRHPYAPLAGFRDPGLNVLGGYGEWRRDRVWSQDEAEPTSSRSMGVSDRVDLNP